MELVISADVFVAAEALLMLMIMSQVTVGVVCWMYGDEESPEPGEDTEAE